MTAWRQDDDEKVTAATVLYVQAGQVETLVCSALRTRMDLIDTCQMRSSPLDYCPPVSLHQYSILIHSGESAFTTEL